MRKLLFLFIILAFFVMHANAQTGIFKTYNDYQKNNIERMDDFTGYTYADQIVTLHFVKGGDTVKIKCKDIWGFKYNDALFRIPKQLEVPMHVDYKANKSVYYENGCAHLDLLKNNTIEEPVQLGGKAYISKDINSEMYELHYKRSVFRHIKKNQPEFKPLVKYFSKANKTTFVRHYIHECMKKFDAQ